MKTISMVAEELREQIEEATDPKDPTRLKEYVDGIRDGIGSLVEMLPDDPTFAAIAFYGQIKFEDRKVLENMSDLSKVIEPDWVMIKGAIKMRPNAHAAVKILEDAGLVKVLSLAILANYKNQRRVKMDAEKEQENEQ